MRFSPSTTGVEDSGNPRRRCGGGVNDEFLEKHELRRGPDGWLRWASDELVERSASGKLTRSWLLWFWLKADARTARAWRIWLATAAIVGASIYWWQLSGLVVGLVVLRWWFVPYASMVKACMNGPPTIGVVRIWKPHVVDRFVLGEIEGTKLFLGLPRELAQQLVQEWAAIEVHYIPDTSSVVLLALRPLQETAAATC